MASAHFEAFTTLNYRVDPKTQDYEDKMRKLCELKAAGWNVVSVVPASWRITGEMVDVTEMHVMLSK